ncbi:site-specific integrase [Legionella jordanis]|uniref:Site specific recombinase n=1 Tax=Legionella jordanis TaxID=456 RepID=A0A0W0VDU9_9GAMM|nr:site-specific integrase [Legionella jordanis]KTD18264.1 site specific recombinase [Legionella jordanis]RMX01208.1 hypothetical protein EAW55_11570 [Legionella jordanis]VEH13393.1 site specific recombinase [Legionella jordanis]VEH13653.1 site specific recombinase [Legionella jordanis]
MITRKPKSKGLTLEELVFAALSQLQVLHYDERSIRRYQTVWRKLIDFAKQNNYKGKLTEKLMMDFLAYYDIKHELPTYTYKDWRRHAEYGLTILWHYARFGYFERCKIVLSKLNMPKSMQKYLEIYKEYCEKKRYLRPYTVQECLRQLGLLFDFLGKRNISTFDQIRPQDLSDYVCSLSRFSQKTVASIVSHLRVFFRFLLYKGKLEIDLSEKMPSVSFCQQAKIPSVWDRGLVTQLLNTIDRGSPRGKRDYAILLLAYRLGLRLGDIRTLKFDDIDWESESISIIQSKTQTPLVLPLTNEVGNALIDYIKHARPKAQYREVFLRLRPPVKPFNQNSHLYHIVAQWRHMAGIEFRSQQKQGLHSLRHTLATHLLEDNTPFSLIANILGHASMNSTMIYAKASVETLRQVALSIKEMDHVR